MVSYCIAVITHQNRAGDFLLLLRSTDSSRHFVLDPTCFNFRKLILVNKLSRVMDTWNYFCKHNENSRSCYRSFSSHFLIGQTNKSCDRSQNETIKTQQKRQNNKRWPRVRKTPCLSSNLQTKIKRTRTVASNQNRKSCEQMIPLFP